VIWKAKWLKLLSKKEKHNDEKNIANNSIM